MIVCGPLLGVAVEIFEKAHGINGRQKEEMETLKVETITKYNCSENAFLSLVVGHSYDEVLAPLRKLVPGYGTKEDARKKKKKQKKRAKSCESSPRTIYPISSLPGKSMSVLTLDGSDYFCDGDTPPRCGKPRSYTDPTPLRPRCLWPSINRNSARER
jgi:hypothetical protein